MAIELLPPGDGNDLYFEQTDDIGFVRVDDIDLGERLRPIDPIHVEVLGRAIMREGQATPIVVCRLPGRAKWTLVAGAHRVCAAIKFDIELLRAEIIGADKIGRRQREVSENLWRKDLDPVDRANFVAELVRLSKLRAGIDPDATAQQVAAGSRWQKAVDAQSKDARDTMSHVYGWTDEVADQIGLSRRTLSRDLMLHTRLAPSCLAMLRMHRHPVASNATQLRALAMHEPDQQSKIAAQLTLEDKPAKSVAEAWARIAGTTKPATDPEAKRLSAFLGAFSRMSLAEKKGALAHLAGQLPAGFALVDPDSEKKPNRMRLITIGGALDRAFNVVTDLIDGEEAVDDERLGDVAGDLQTALADITEFLGGRS